MCSFAGVVNFKKNLFTYEAYNRLLVRDMVLALSNNDTKNYGEWVGEHLAFALAHQPDDEQPLKKTVEGHEFVITSFSKLNNFDELKKDLEKFGYTFTSNSDAEIILYEYIHYGENCCKKLDGIFTFCIWDSMRQQVFVCCDKLGTKPFIYANLKDSIVFATDIESLFRYPELTPKIDKDGLSEIFAFFPYKTLGISVFSGVKELKPATYMIIKRSGVFEKQYSNFEKETTKINSDDLKARINVLKPIIRETLDLWEYLKTKSEHPLFLHKFYENPQDEKTYLNDILKDNNSPINVFVDRENALSTPKMYNNLIQLNNWFKEFNPIII